MLDVERLPSLLVMEESLAERTALMEALEGHSSYPVYVSVRRAGVLELLRKQKIELVLLSLRQPYDGSLSLIWRIREAHPEIKILAISGNEPRAAAAEPPSSSGLDATLRFGADRVLHKPIEAGQLCEAVEALLAVSR